MFDNAVFAFILRPALLDLGERLNCSSFHAHDVQISKEWIDKGTPVALHSLIFIYN